MASREEVIDSIIFYDDLNRDEQEELAKAVANDSELSELFSCVQQVRQEVRHRLDRTVPDRNVLVLYALATSGSDELLTTDERKTLEVARPALEQAFRDYPSLEDVVACINRQANAFESCWCEHFEPSDRGHRDHVRQLAPSRPARRPLRSIWAWRFSAVAAVVLFISVILFLNGRDKNLQNVQTAQNEVRVVQLADGSVIRLMGGSHISYRAPEEGETFDRKVSLEGKAYFDVRPDSRPFSVETPTARTTVLGTTFGLVAGTEMTEVFLASGKVSFAPVSDPSNMVVLKPGEKSRIARGGAPTTPQPVELARELDWSGRFIFQATPIDEIARLLSAFYNVRITVDPELSTESVTGEFPQDLPAGDILNTVAATLGATVQQDGTQTFKLTEGTK